LSSKKESWINSDPFERLLLETDLAYFAERILDMEIGAHHKEWSSHCAQQKRLALLAPRDHGKSHFFSFAFVIWRIYFAWKPSIKDIIEVNPDPKAAKNLPKIPVGYIFSNTQPQAIAFLDIIKTELMSNPKLQHLVPKMKESWSKLEIKTSNGVIVKARGYGSAVRGAHPSWVVCDDVLNDESIYSELTRKKQLDYFYSALTPLVVPGGQIVVVGTPFHSQDLYQHLKENRKYFFKRYFTTPEQPLWPARYSQQMLEDKREEIGSTRFSREYECLDGETLIRTSFGFKQIKEVKQGDLVLSHSGAFNRVLNVWKNPKRGRQMLKVKTSNNMGFVLTEDHELYVAKTDYRRDISRVRVEWIAAKDISCRPSERIYLKVPLVSRPEQIIDEELAYLVGWYVAEGSLGSGQSMALSLNNSVDVSRIQKASQKHFGKKFVPYRKKGEKCTNWTLNLKAAKTFFKQFGTSCYEKTAGIILTAQKEAKLAFLSGYFSGDGHWSSSGVEAVSASFQLICDLSDVLADVGAACQIRQFQKAGDGVILGRKVRLHDVWEVTVSGSNATFLDGIPRRQASSFVRDGYLYSRIKSILPVDHSDENVYDLHVERDHSYVGLHGVFHNCLPISDESSLFTESMLQQCFDNQFTMPKQLTSDLRSQFQGVYVGMDLALSANVGADYTVITTIGVDQHKNYWILDIRRKKGIGMTEQLHLLQDVNSCFRPDKIFVEDNSYQRVFRDEIVRSTDMPVEGFTTTAYNKNTLERGVPSLQILFENRKIIIPRKEVRDRELTDALCHELKCFTWLDGKLQGVGAHDDMVMSFYLAKECASSSSFTFTFD
jgi:intein/homing endonuclease/phage terminase large subunit-like protein